jgi:uncharacterized membrane protein YkoI
MSKRRRVIAGVMAVLVVGAIGTGVAVATGRDEEALTGSAYDRATAAALDHVGEGTVTETEAGDGDATYEVEIRRDDGSQIEVQLDQNFEVTGTEGDDDGPNDKDEGGGEDD